jgi:hypothetical protein
MSFMLIAEVVAVLAVYGGRAAAYAWVPEGRLRKRTAAFGRRNQAWIDPELLPVVDGFTRREGRGAAAAVLATGAATCVVAVVAGPHHGLPLVCYAAAQLLFIGASTVRRLRTAGREFPLPPGRVVARPRRISPGDYVPASTRVVVGLDVLALSAFSVGVTAHPGWGDLGWPYRSAVAVAAAGATAAAVALLVAERRICDRPQPAADECHLYFLDAWRAELLRMAYAALVLIAVVVPFGLALTSQAPGWFGWSLVSGAAVVVVNQRVLRRNTLHFRRRLWPTLREGQVLGPGQAVPPRAPVVA